MTARYCLVPMLAIALAACGNPVKVTSDTDTDDATLDTSTDGETDTGEDSTPPDATDTTDEDVVEEPVGYCGDEIVQEELDEVCDDGNNEDGDGCSADCSSDETCGNGITDSAVGEECDGEEWCTDECMDTREDSDGDTIVDLDEDESAGVDSDGDGTPDYLDTDSDGDTIPDSAEAGDSATGTPPVDTDGDTIEDFRDLDADGDGIPDSVEGRVDTDGDGSGDWVDTDSDGDGLADEDEAGDAPATPRDTDGDTMPDYTDLDSDGDGIPDLTETLVDTDGDGDGNAIDTDSDDDGLSDEMEGTTDTDGDGDGNYIDLDSDGDGLGDADEVMCSSLGVHSYLHVDTDSDGYDDLVEHLVGSDLCDATSDVLTETGTEFFFELPPAGSSSTDTLYFYPQVEHTDVFFSVDTTGSMGGELANLQSGLGTIMSEVGTRVADPAYGVGHWEDFPISPYGYSTDVPWELVQTPTTSTTVAQAAVDSLSLGSGYDGPESGYESLYQIGAGTGVTWTGGSVPAYSGSGLGGVGFRVGTLPIVLHITDAPSHLASDYTTGGIAAHTKLEAFAALDALGVRVITLYTAYTASSTTLTQLDEICYETGADVPVCAFKTGATTWRCGVDQCCTGIGGAPVPSAGGRCLLNYRVNYDGTGLGTAVVDGVDAIIRYSTFEVYTEIRDDGSTSTPDTSCFIKRAEALSFTPPPTEPEHSCTPTAIPDSFFGSTYNNGFSSVATGTNDVTTTGTELTFTINAENDTCVTATSTGQIFTAYIDIVDVATYQVLDTQAATIYVPPAP